MHCVCFSDWHSICVCASVTVHCICVCLSDWHCICVSVTDTVSMCVPVTMHCLCFSDWHSICVCSRDHALYLCVFEWLTLYLFQWLTLYLCMFEWLTLYLCLSDWHNICVCFSNPGRYHKDPELDPQRARFQAGVIRSVTASWSSWCCRSVVCLVCMEDHPSQFP